MRNIEIKYEWCSGIQYSERIYNFLKEVDKDMIPQLSARVVISEYANKLAYNSDTIFVKNQYQDIASCSVYCNRETAFISSIAVKREFRNQQIATKLLKETIEHVKGKKCLKILLNVWDKNTPAVKLYEKMGFSLVSKEGEWNAMMIVINRE